MKLSKTLMINAELLPSNKKAFTLAEVLITLSILGVVAALTIPSLVNRNSDIAAQTKPKKAIAAYETAAGTYMAESGKADLKLLMGDSTKPAGDKACPYASNYFKIVSQNSANTCEFMTSDGTFWSFNGKSGFAIAYDSETAPRYGVIMWVNDGNVNTEAFSTTTTTSGTTTTKTMNNPPTEPTKGTDNKTTFVTPVHGYFKATEFLKTNSSQLTSAEKDDHTYDSITKITTTTTSGGG